MSRERAQHLYRVVVDTLPPPPEEDAPCWRCDNGVAVDAVSAVTGRPFWECDMCGINLSPENIGGRKRSFLSAAPANRRVGYIVDAGGQAHVEKSDPITWPPKETPHA